MLFKNPRDKLQVLTLAKKMYPGRTDFFLKQYEEAVRRPCGRRSGRMVSAFVPGASGPGSSPGRGHCVVFLGKTLHSHGASLHPGV